MDDRTIISRLHRRVGLGLAPGQLDAALARGPAGEAARLVDPDRAGLPPTPDPWRDAELGFDREANAARGAAAVTGWLDRMVTTQRPAEERVVWFWHGHFVSSVGKVRSALALVNQLRLFQRLGLGPFGPLVRGVSVDPAMLVYLDGRESTRTSVNENYGRELLELFTLGRGNYTEADVRAGAVALTGWTVRPGSDGPATFVPARHDPAPQSYLGGTVSDVDGVVARVVDHPALPGFVAGKVCRALLGPAVDAPAVSRVTDAFRAAGLDVRALLRAVVGELVAGVDGGPIVLEPVRWFVAAQRATGAQLKAETRLGLLRSMGQVPLRPPNVAGWPGGDAWLSSSAVVGRFNAAVALAGTTPAANPAARAAAAGDAEGLAQALGLPGPFGEITRSQLAAARTPTERLALALASPEFLLA
jgi:uncharacterized protein (DUF1800 family)